MSRWNRILLIVAMTPSEVRRIEDLKPMRASYADVSRKMEEIQPFLKQWAGQ